MSNCHKAKKDDCKPPRQKKCDRHHGHGHGHGGGKRKKCETKKPWSPPVRSGGHGGGHGGGRP
jgi:hypothetical protein